MRFMRKFKEEGTLLFVSHDTDAVAGLCDVVMLLDHGSIEAVGSAREVCDLYRKQYYAQFQDVEDAGTDDAPHLAGSESRRRPVAVPPEDLVDQRLKYINVSQYRNDIELGPMNGDAGGFGEGGARIVAVDVLDGLSGQPLSWVVGGELVVVRVQAAFERLVERPIVGFMVKDRLGQVLFSDNTYLEYRALQVPQQAGDGLTAEFEFRMPVLPMGDYFMDVAVADGTQADHVQLHWLHEARLLHSRSSSASTGLVGVPMRRIELTGWKGEDE